uniref:Sialophorin n=2 Tax=Papio anubis TaxID=9555 RepID=A0A8I5NYG6_PAPAN
MAPLSSWPNSLGTTNAKETTLPSHLLLYTLEFSGSYSHHPPLSPAIPSITPSIPFLSQEPVIQIPDPALPCLPQSCPSLGRWWSDLAPALRPYQLSRSQLLPVCLEMAVLLLLLGVLVVSPEALGDTTAMQTPMPGETSGPLVSTSKYLSIDSEMYTASITSDPKADSAGDQTSALPPSTSVNEGSPLGTSLGASTGSPLPEPTTLQNVSFEMSSMPQENPHATSHPAVPITANSPGSHTMTGGTMTTNSPETSSRTSGAPVTVAASSQETSKGTSGSPLTMATISLESSNGTSGPPVTIAAGSLETSTGTTGPPVTMTTGSLEPSNVTTGPPVTMTTGSLEPSSGASGPQVSSVKLSTMMTPTTSTNAITVPFRNPDENSGGMLPVAVLVALLVVIVLVALLLLWRRRQKRRTGALVLSRGGKRNGVVDAWAGPAQVPEEGAVTVTVGGSGGDKGSGVPDGEGSGRRPTLTTFFGRRKSRQGSLAMEELKSGSGSNLKGEEEPLVASEDGALDAPAPDEPEAGDRAAP